MLNQITEFTAFMNNTLAQTLYIYFEKAWKALTAFRPERPLTFTFIC